MAVIYRIVAMSSALWLSGGKIEQHALLVYSYVTYGLTTDKAGHTHAHSPLCVLQFLILLPVLSVFM